MNYNKAILLGNITRDIEQKSLPSGQTVVTFGLATNRVYTDQAGAKQQQTEFHNIVAFGKLAEICARYLTKGGLVLAEGRLQTRNWTDQSGIKKYRTEIILENMQMGPKRSSQDNDTSHQPTNNTNTNNRPVATPSLEEIPVINADEPYSSETEEIDPKNVPF